MKTLKYFIFALALSLFAVSCKPAEEAKKENTNAIWLWGSHMKEAPIQEWADKGFGHILLNEAAFDKWG
jgi:hypothetical protein